VSAVSLVGFAVVFVLVAGVTSAALAALAPRLRRRGPATERRLVELAAVVPVILAGAVVLVLLIESLVGLDHCDNHGDHAHLCLRHGLAWAERPWALALLLGAGVLVLTRGAALMTTLLRGWHAVARLRAALPASGVHLVESPRVFCFVAGLRHPAVYASTAARAALADDEWAAMLAHERGHVTERDLGRRLRLELALLLAAPGLAGSLRARWDAATERLRDVDAAAATSADAVARALVRMARAQRGPVPVGMIAAFAPPPPLLAERVHAMLDEAPTGVASARRLARQVGLAGLVVVGLTISFAGPLHHALESLLG
jgi:hypothetical protein